MPIIVLAFATLLLGVIVPAPAADAAVLTGGASLSHPFSKPVWWPLATGGNAPAPARRSRRAHGGCQPEPPFLQAGVVAAGHEHDDGLLPQESRLHHPRRLGARRRVDRQDPQRPDGVRAGLRHGRR